MIVSLCERKELDVSEPSGGDQRPIVLQEERTCRAHRTGAANNDYLTHRQLRFGTA